MSNMHEGARMRAALTPQWWGAFVAVPLVVGSAAAFLGKGDVESSLQTRVERNVLHSGVSSVGVVVDGQNVRATVPTNASDATIESVRSAVLDVDGVRSVQVER